MEKIWRMMQVTNRFKKSHGVLAAAIGAWKPLLTEFHLPPDDWEELDDRYQHRQLDTWKHAYAYHADMDDDNWLLWITKGRRDMDELRAAMPMFHNVAHRDQGREYDGRKRCQTCGQWFTFQDIETASNLPAWKAFRGRVEIWDAGRCCVDCL